MIFQLPLCCLYGYELYSWENWSCYIDSWHMVPQYRAASERSDEIFCHVGKHQCLCPVLRTDQKRSLLFLSSCMIQFEVVSICCSWMQ